MAGPITLDASVVISAMRAAEAHHPESRSLLESLADGERPLVEPTLLLVEVAAAIARGVPGASAAVRIMEEVRSLPYLALIPLDEVVARRAAALAAELRLRGADAVYAAVAQRFGAVLVTVDAEQLARCRGKVDAMSPAEALRR